MAKLINPALFSQKFGVLPALLDKAGFIDPILNGDTKLFIDPLLIEISSNKKISKEAFDLLKKRFSEVIALVNASQLNTDKAWTAALQRLDLSEAPQTCLGYGGSSIGGSSRPIELKQKILKTAKEIINLGEKDPEIIPLMGLFEEGVGPDTISDMTTNFIQPILAEITETFCVENKITTKLFPKYGNRNLPENPFRPGSPVLLVPKDILRNLPIANDWNEVSKVIFENEDIRSAVNAFLGDITKSTVLEKKEAIRTISLRSLANFKKVFEAVLDSGAYYDANEDIYGYYAFRKILQTDLRAFEDKIIKPSNTTKAELIRVVNDIVSNFKKMIEDNNLWEMLWYKDKARRERAAQLLFFGIADVFCKANNIDISPEMNAGGGPVDFKFSQGYSNRILVEVKRSLGSVVQGYKKQLEVYKKASETDAAIYLIIDLGKLDSKLKAIQKIQAEKLINNEIVSEIIVVNAKKQVSASKQK